jgi:O-succinylbenzoic acid--CoA ligase
MDLLRSILNEKKASTQNEGNLVLLNPALPEDFQQQLKKIAAKEVLNGPHLWVTSSGSSASSEREIKLIALSEKALLASASSVNEHLNCQKSDRWLNVLPTFHVGGLGIFFRGHLSESEVININHSTYKWNPEEFYQKLINEKITLTSLVPTQIFDLVTSKFRVPQSLRAIVIGGAALAPSLYHQARQLGWPLLPSFGMTEVCSQIATAPLSSLKTTDQSTQIDSIPQRPELQILNHVELKIDDTNLLSVKSSSLMSCYIQVRDNSVEVHSFPEGSWYKTQDCANIKDVSLEILGRSDETIKILGENVSLPFLRERLASFFSQGHLNIDWALIADEDLRKGKQLILVVAKQVDNLLDQSLQQVLIDFNQQVLPFERVNQIKYVDKIPKSSIGKILYGRLEFT